MVSNVTGSHDNPIPGRASTDPATTELSEHDPAELGELERSILQLLWQHGTLSAEQVREELDLLDRPLKDSTVRTVLRRLEEKGYATHAIDNRTFLYSPAEAAPMVAGRAVKRILEWFCEGSVEALLVGMVDSAVLDRKELQRLADRIASARSEAKPASNSANSTPATATHPKEGVK
jgi:predicted transcriptional regulator